MKKQYLIIGVILLCIIGASLYYTKKSIFFYPRSYTKKKVLILTSSGGGGNLEASNAIKAYLDTDYEIELCHAFKEILAPLDPFNTITFQKYSSEDIYNTLLPGKHFQLLSWIYQFGKWYTQAQKDRIIPLLRNYFISSKPDLIISVIPVINNIVLEVAQELSVPFLLIPTDLDVKPYILNITQPTYEKFYVGLIFDDPEIIAPLQEAEIVVDFIHLLGAPLRPDFFARKNKSRLKKHYQLDGNKPVFMILMGSQGADEIEKYVAQLITIDKPCHLIICIGKNEKSAKDLAQLTFPKHISSSIVGFTPYISDYMALSDVLITKSGTLSVCESLYMDLPLFLDATSTLLPWEEFNHHFIKKHTFGISIQKLNDVASLISNVIEHTDELEIYQKNIQKLGKKNCSKELKKLVKKIVEK